MTSNKPYFVKALYDWIVDNNCTPFIVVNAQLQGVQVPNEHVKDGQIVLNIAPHSVQSLVMDNEFIEFHARFSGVARHIIVPMAAVMAIYARENGQGMAFAEEPGLGAEDASDEAGLKPVVTPEKSEAPQHPRSEEKADVNKSKKPSLKVIK